MLCRNEDCRDLAAELLQTNYMSDGQGTVVRTSTDPARVILGDYSPPL